MNTVTVMVPPFARHAARGSRRDASTAIEGWAHAIRYPTSMIPRHRLAEIASVLGDPGRAAMVTSLWDGRLRPASELAKLAGVSAPTASSHLARLVAVG